MSREVLFKEKVCFSTEGSFFTEENVILIIDPLFPRYVWGGARSRRFYAHYMGVMNIDLDAFSFLR